MVGAYLELRYQKLLEQLLEGKRTAVLALYGKKVNSLESHAARTQGIAMIVRACVYMSLVSTMSGSLGLVVKLLDVQGWGPFRMSTYYLLFALFAVGGMSASSRRQTASGGAASDS